MTALIIEDELPAGKRLELLLKDRQIAVLSVQSTVAKSLAWLRTNKHPDWIFIDIELRDGNAFDLLRQITPESRMIFTTAYPDKALDAFHFGGMDYLQKPIDSEKLSAAIEKVLRMGRILSEPTVKERQVSFLVAAGSVLRKIEENHISCFTSANNTTFVEAGGRQFPIGSSLEKLEDELPADRFFRISRQHIVRRDAIEKAVKQTVVLKDTAAALPISRSRYKEFVQWFAD